MPAIKQASTKQVNINTNGHDGTVQIALSSGGYGNNSVSMDKTETKALIAILRAAIDFEE